VVDEVLTISLRILTHTSADVTVPNRVTQLLLHWLHVENTPHLHVVAQEFRGDRILDGDVAAWDKLANNFSDLVSADERCHSAGCVEDPVRQPGCGRIQCRDRDSGNIFYVGVITGECTAVREPYYFAPQGSFE